MLGYHYDDGGFMELYGSLLPEDGAVVQKALEAVAQKLHKEQEQDTTTNVPMASATPMQAHRHGPPEEGPAGARAHVRVPRLHLQPLPRRPPS
jgi:hypothetical protein